MREIKFRAWDKEEKKMYDMEWLSGPADWEMVSTLQMILDGDMPEMELMQYTGLKDKNGKEIYSGDILSTGLSHENAVKLLEVVGLEDGAIRFKEIGGDYKTSWNTELFKYQNQVEVIGNIYENPELLKEF